MSKYALKPFKLGTSQYWIMKNEQLLPFVRPGKSRDLAFVDENSDFISSWYCLVQHAYEYSCYYKYLNFYSTTTRSVQSQYRFLKFHLQGDHRNVKEWNQPVICNTTLHSIYIFFLQREYCQDFMFLMAAIFSSRSL